MDKKTFMIRTAILVTFLFFAPFFINPVMKWIFFEEVESVENFNSIELSHDSPFLKNFKTNPKRTYEMRIQKVTTIKTSDFLKYDTIHRFDTTFLERKRYVTTITTINK